ncbi:MAG: carbohydrate ABC transporter permease [Akkermansiaceae bacterium]|nr:carbohydrate ABC transporter permease [Armatimonadota bacterium]
MLRNITQFRKEWQPGLRLLMFVGTVLFLIPVLWMLSTALKTPETIVRDLASLRWLPRPMTLQNFQYILGKAEEFPVWRWTANSVFISLATTALVLIVDALAAFSYARLKWKGRDTVFAVLLATMLVPGQALLIPAYLLIRSLGWFDSYAALIVPAGAGTFGVFLLRQFFAAIPIELEEAARMDGCGPLGILRHVILPLSLPAFAALGIFTFIATWNAFEGPLLFTDSLEMRTLPIGISIFQGRYNTEYGPMMAAASLAAVPVIIAFLLFQRHIIRGISLTGIAGR